jgi:hypothetical protein
LQPVRLFFAPQIQDNARSDCETDTMATPVTRDQFVVAPEGITHVPTGASFTPHPGSPLSGNLGLGHLGNRLPNGDDHRPDDVRAMMQRLWAEYVAANPSAFHRS